MSDPECPGIAAKNDLCLRLWKWVEMGKMCFPKKKSEVERNSMAADESQLLNNGNAQRSLRSVPKRAMRTVWLTAAVILALLSFPSVVPWMIACWLIWHTLSVARDRPGWIPLATCLAILIAKRVYWIPSLVLLAPNGIGGIRRKEWDVTLARRASFDVARFPSCSPSSCLPAAIPKGWSYVSPGDPSEWVPRRREGHERRATLGSELNRIDSPNGAALTGTFFHD